MGKKKKNKQDGEKDPAKDRQGNAQTAGPSGQSQGQAQPASSGQQQGRQGGQKEAQKHQGSGAGKGQQQQQQEKASVQHGGNKGPQQQGELKQSQQKPKPQTGDQGQSQQQSSWGGNQGQQQPGQWPGPGPGGQGGQQQRGPPSQAVAQSQQQSAWGGNQGQQSRGPAQQARGQGQQQGSWGGNQGQQQAGQWPGPGGQGGQQQRGPPSQAVAQSQQQSAWGGNQGQQSRGPAQQARGQGQQQGSWGGNQGQQQAGKLAQPGGQGGQQQRGPPSQAVAQNQQQSSWGGNQGQQSRGPAQQARGQGQQQGSLGGNQGQQQAGQWAQGAQQRGPAPQGSQQQHQQRGGPGQQRGGPGQQRGGQQSMETSFQKMSVSNEQVLPLKPKSCSGIVRGTLGTPGSVEVNYLKLDINNMPNEAYHYDVTITPDRPKKFLRPAFDQCQREMFGTIAAAYDGMKSCYTISRLPTPIEHTVQVADSGNRMKDFKVEIKETTDLVVDLNSLRTYHRESVSDKPMRAIQVLDVVLSGNNHERGIRVGRSFFHKPANPFDLEGGYEAWTGLFQAAILGEQPFINVDIAHKSFPRKSSLIEYLQNQNIRPDEPLNNYSYRDVEKFLKGIDIVYEPPTSFGSFPRRYRVLGIGDPASKLRFRNDEGLELTVAAYFQSRGYQLRFPNLNCVKVGSTVRSIALPMELCHISEGQALNRKDDAKQVQKMIRFAATSTNVRKEKIMNILQYFKHNDSPIIRAFGIQIGSNFIKVPMRNLPSPYMEYLGGQTVTTFKGAWRMDGKKFLACSKPQGGGHKWCIMYEKNPGSRLNYNELNNFKNNVLRESEKLNMNLEKSAEIIEYNSRDIASTLQDLAKQKYALVFVVLGKFASYATVKQSAELRVGILTQCIKEQTVGRTARDQTVFSNILLKVNGKLNGTNHKISADAMMAPIKKVMYLGADVTHPSPDQREIPSVVGVAASHDLFGACYNMQYRLQSSKREDIEDMESIVLTHLQVFAKYQKGYPEQIIYYRDGVSDGQFRIIRNVELTAIKRACAKLKCQPKLTCVIVVKRHHTRFFPMKQPRDARDFNNVDPGTVVDQHITHPNEVQFFMVSHQSIQGTAKPTRYNVIMDESKFNIDVLQKLTYNLCHLFPRCNRVVSYPAPAYLAHLVAFRGRVYLEGARGYSKDLKVEYERRLIKPNFMETNPMYFI